MKSTGDGICQKNVTKNLTDVRADLSVQSGLSAPVQHQGMVKRQPSRSWCGKLGQPLAKPCILAIKHSKMPPVKTAGACRTSQVHIGVHSFALSICISTGRIQIIMLTWPGCCLFSLKALMCSVVMVQRWGCLLLCYLLYWCKPYIAGHWRCLGCMLSTTYEALQDSQPSILIQITLHEDDTNSNQQSANMHWHGQGH